MEIRYQKQAILHLNSNWNWSTCPPPSPCSSDVVRIPKLKDKNFSPLTNHIRTNDIKEAFHSTANSLCMSHLTLTDMLQNIQSKRALSAQEELVLIVKCQLVGNQKETFFS